MRVTDLMEKCTQFLAKNENTDFAVAVPLHDDMGYIFRFHCRFWGNLYSNPVIKVYPDDDTDYKMRISEMMLELTEFLRYNEDTELAVIVINGYGDDCIVTLDFEFVNNLHGIPAIKINSETLSESEE